MVHLKTDEEIAIMKEAGHRLKKVMAELIPTVKTGKSTRAIDAYAEKLIKSHGGEPGFKRVKGYKWATCLCINEQVVHTPPSDRLLQDGDVLTIDIGFFYKGFHTDHATTLVVGSKKDHKIEHFLKVGRQTLVHAINAVKRDHYIGEISQVIEREITKNKFYILKELTGHGVGHDLHEEPYIPGFVDRPVRSTYKIRPGLVVAIEVIYSIGTEKIAYEKGSDWSIVTQDGSMSACFEHTVAVTSKNTIILT